MLKYWDDFRSKYGFFDGNVPPDAAAHRDVIVKLINTLAAAVKSDTRVFKYDRDGLHNPYLILYRHKNTTAKAACHLPEHCPDEAFLQMMEWLDDYEHDYIVNEFVDVVVTINKVKLDQGLKMIVKDCRDHKKKKKD